MSKKDIHEVIIPVQFSVKYTCEVEGNELIGYSAAFNPFLERDDGGDNHPLNEVWRSCMEDPPIMDNHELYEGWPDKNDRVIRTLSASLGRVIKWHGQQEAEEEKPDEEA